MRLMNVSIQKTLKKLMWKTDIEKYNNGIATVIISLR